MFVLLKWTALLCLLSRVSSAATIDGPQIDGTYEGEMRLVDIEDPIPLSSSLVLTDELEKVEVSPGVFEMMKTIDSSFLIDREGGPFAFTKVRYRLNTSEIDMRYMRTKGVTVGQPSSYQLVGRVLQDNTIQGRVLSGFKGEIGTFKLARVAYHPLKPQTQYAGVWSGAVKLVPEGEYERFGLEIAESGFATINPEQLEFDYTLGKIGHMDYGIVQAPLLNIVIDYLHRKIALSSVRESASLTIEATLDPKTQRLKGFFATQYGGKRGEFDLPRIR